MLKIFFEIKMSLHLFLLFIHNQMRLIATFPPHTHFRHALRLIFIINLGAIKLKVFLLLTANGILLLENFCCYKGWCLMTR